MYRIDYDFINVYLNLFTFNSFSYRGYKIFAYTHKVAGADYELIAMKEDPFYEGDEFYLFRKVRET